MIWQNVRLSGEKFKYKKKMIKRETKGNIIKFGILKSSDGRSTFGGRSTSDLESHHKLRS